MTDSSATDGSTHNGRCVQYKQVRCDRGIDTLVKAVHPPPLLTTVLTLKPPRTLVLYCTPATQWTSLSTLTTCTHSRTCFQGIQEYLQWKRQQPNFDITSPPPLVLSLDQYGVTLPHRWLQWLCSQTPLPS